MVLIVEKRVRENPWIIPPDNMEGKACRYFIPLSSTFLSKPYKLEVGDRIEGEIIDIKAFDFEEGLSWRRNVHGHRVQISEFTGKMIEFFLDKWRRQDILFIHMIDWEFLKEFAFPLPPIGFSLTISVKLKNAIKEEKEILLYTEKDFKLDENNDPFSL